MTSEAPWWHVFITSELSRFVASLTIALRPAASLGNLKAGLLDFWAFSKRAGFCEVARDLLLAALIAGIGL